MVHRTGGRDQCRVLERTKFRHQNSQTNGTTTWDAVAWTWHRSGRIFTRVISKLSSCHLLGSCSHSRAGFRHRIALNYLLPTVDAAVLGRPIDEFVCAGRLDDSIRNSNRTRDSSRSELHRLGRQALTQPSCQLIGYSH